VTAVQQAEPAVLAPDRRDQTRAALWALLGVVLLGVLGGVVWGLIAPAEQFLVVSPGRGLPLTDESDHEFDALAIFLCLGGIVGAVSIVAAWQWRRLRGPILFAGTLAGTVVGGAAMWLVGEQVARWRHPRQHNPPLHHVVTLAPAVGSGAALWAALFAAAVVLAVLVILSPSDDLGSSGRRAAPVAEPEAEPEP
jgi:hypothetical protein